MSKKRNTVRPPKRKRWKNNLALNLKALLEPFGLDDLVTSGSLLKNAPLYAFIIMIGCLYIWNTVISDKSKRSIETLTIELEDLQYRDLQLQQEVNRETELARLEKRAKSKGLDWTDNVPYVIELD